MYEDGKNFTLVNHKSGGYQLDKLNKDEGEFFFSNYKVGSVGEVELFCRIREILRTVESFKEKVKV